MNFIKSDFNKKLMYIKKFNLYFKIYYIIDNINKILYRIN